MHNEIPIFLACDDNYIPFLGTALHTLIKNANKDYHYRAIILSNGLKMRIKPVLKRKKHQT